MDWIDTINHPQNGEKVILDPDLVIFLDVAPEKSLERIRRTRGEFQVYEDYPSLSEVYKNFNKAMTKYSHRKAGRSQKTSRWRMR